MTVVVEHFEAYGQCRDSRRIASLETENAELKDKLNNLSKVAEVRLANWQKYEKENAELKNRNAELKGMYAHSAREAGTYKQFLELKEKENAELKEQIEKMKDCLNKWYKQHNDDDYTETFYDNLLRDTEKCLWGDSVND